MHGKRTLQSICMSAQEHPRACKQIALLQSPPKGWRLYRTLSEQNHAELEHSLSASFPIRLGHRVDRLFLMAVDGSLPTSLAR